ncbi:hypothetical protein ACFFRR_006813 [Megaselia abdita]
MWQSVTSGLTISDLFDSFDFFTDTRSDELILQDFDHLYPTAMGFFENWKTQNFKKVLNKARCYRDDYAKLLMEVIDLNDRMEDKYTLTLTLIPYLMAPNGRKNRNGKTANKNDIQMNFISVYKQIEDFGNSDDDYVLNLLVEDGKVSYSTYNLHETTFKYDDPIEAFTTLFAKIMVLNLKFPKLCDHVWQFVQQGLFGIPVGKPEMRHVTQEALRTTNL